MASRKAPIRRKLNSGNFQNVLPAAASICCTPSTAGPQSPASTRDQQRAAAARTKKCLDGSGLGTGALSEQINAESKTSDLIQVREVPGTAVARLDSPAAPAQESSSSIVRTIDGLVTGRLVKRYKRFLADIQVCLPVNFFQLHDFFPDQ